MIESDGQLTLLPTDKVKIATQVKIGFVVGVFEFDADEIIGRYDFRILSCRCQKEDVSIFVISVTLQESFYFIVDLIFPN